MNNKNMTFTRICKGCGKVMVNVGRSCQRCPACARVHQNLLSQEQKERAHEEALRLKFEREHNGAALRADVARYDSQGVSYGKGRLKEMLAAQKKKQPTGVDAPAGCKG